MEPGSTSDKRAGGVRDCDTDNSAEPLARGGFYCILRLPFTSRTQLSGAMYDTSTARAWVDVDLGALLSNYDTILRRAEAGEPLEGTPDLRGWQAGLLAPIVEGDSAGNEAG